MRWGEPERRQPLPEALRGHAADLREQERHPACRIRSRPASLSFMSDRSTSGPRPTQAGPPLWLLAGVSIGLLLAGLASSAALGGVLPSPFADPAVIREYFLGSPAAVRASGVSAMASAVPLALYAATASARLRQLGVTAPGATIALAGGVLAAGALAMSGLLQWTLASPAVRGEPALVRALHDLAFLTGGPAHVVFLGLLLAGVAGPALLLGLLPRTLAGLGLAVAVLTELSFLSLVWPDLAVLVPLARFPALAWLVAAGLLLPHSRPRAAAA